MPNRAQDDHTAVHVVHGDTFIEDSPSVDGAYHVVEEPGFVVRNDAPNVRLFVDRKLTIVEKDRFAYPPQTLFLDGVYKGAPFMENERRHYALDHHVGCVRPFTLATCEQAVVMVLQGLPLGEGEWGLYINEPDLDAVLASWVVLNHDRLVAKERRLLRKVMPLIRVEGIIDTHGLDMAELSGLPSHLYEYQKRRLDALRAPEIELKRLRRWADLDATHYVKDQLERLDRELIGRAAIDDAPPSADELREVTWPQRRVAVLCRSTQGIYEVEEQLKSSHGRALGIIVLDRGDGHFTLLQVDPFLPRSLAELYPILNELDANADEESGNCWGGSTDIGGSPRGTGTALAGQDVLKCVSRLFEK